MSYYSSSHQNTKVAPTIKSSVNTYVPVSFEDKENVFEAVNMALNTSIRQDYAKVPKLELSRTRSYSRQASPNSSFRTQTENDANNSLLHYTNSLQQHLNTQQGSVTRDYAKKSMNIPIPKPQILPQAPSSRMNNIKDVANGTQNNLYNYAYQPQRTKRSLSGSIYSSPAYDNVMQKQYQPDYSLDYSSNYSTNNYNNNYGANALLPHDSLLNESRTVISKETDTYLQEFKNKMKELNRVFDENKEFEQEVQANLKNLQYLGQRQQDIYTDCIKDLDDIYDKYLKQGKSEDISLIIADTTVVTTENYITQNKNEGQNKNQFNSNNSHYNFSDFQDRRSVEIIQGDYSVSYQSQSQCDQNNINSVNDFDQ